MTAAELPENSPVPALTGLRFFAAFFILLGHAADWLQPVAPQSAFITQHLRSVTMWGMPLFFVLSGFVIHYNYSDAFSENYVHTLRRFFIARFARIYPLYIVLFVVALATGGVLLSVMANLEFARDVAAYVPMTHTWVPIVFNDKLITQYVYGLSWSISTEWFFYCAYPLLLFLFVPIRGPVASVLALLAVIAASYALTYGVFVTRQTWVDFGEHFVLRTTGSRPDPSASPIFKWLWYHSPYMRILEFVTGCAVANLFKHTLRFRVSLIESVVGQIAILTCLAGSVWLLLNAYSFKNEYLVYLVQNYMFGGVFAVLIFCLCRYSSPIGALLSWPPILALGEASYSIYLVQTWTLKPFIEQSAVELTGAQLMYWLIRMFVGISVTLVVALGTHRYIERPAKHFVKQLFERKRVPSEAILTTELAVMPTTDRIT